MTVHSLLLPSRLRAAALPALLVLALTASGCTVRVSQGRVRGIPLVALGVVMGVELASLAAPAFKVKGTKPGTVGRATALAGPDEGTLILLAALRGPAMDTDLERAAQALVDGLERQGLEADPAPEFNVPPKGETEDQDRDKRRELRFSTLAAMGYARVLVCALGPGPGQDAPVRVTLVDLSARQRTIAGNMGGPAKAIAPQDLERTHLELMPEAALVMAAVLKGVEPRN